MQIPVEGMSQGPQFNVFVVTGAAAFSVLATASFEDFHPAKAKLAANVKAIPIENEVIFVDCFITLPSIKVYRSIVESAHSSALFFHTRYPSPSSFYLN